MEGGLYVDTPRVIDFEDGKAPVVFVNIINSGMIAARNVSIRINIELANHTTQYVHDQVMTIPAHNAGRECSLRHGKALAIGELLKVQRGELGFRISGHATSQKEKIDYCYKYTPWAFENRPKDLPDFVACDFDTRTAMSGTARPTGFSLTVSMGGPTTARGEISDTSASKEPSDPS
jgi:hypothetical protein